MTPTRPHADEGSPAEAHAARLAAVSRGDAEALDAWFRDEHPAVYRLCFGFLADATEAEDAAQDAMLRLHDSLPRYNRSRPYEPWRNTVVLNVCRDRLRRRTTRRDAEQREPDATLPTRLPRPDEVAEARELQAMLQTALRSLTTREREAFVLRDLNGCSTADTALALGVGESSVRSLLTLARRRLRDLLGPRLPEMAGSGAGPAANPGGAR